MLGDKSPLKIYYIHSQSVLLHLKIVSSKLYLNLKIVFAKKWISQYILKHTFIQMKIGVCKLCDKQGHQKTRIYFWKTPEIVCYR